MRVTQNYRGFVGYHLSMPSHLADLSFVSRTYLHEQAMRTFHYHFHVVDQTINYIERLGNGHLRLLEGESIETLKN